MDPIRSHFGSSFFRSPFFAPLCAFLLVAMKRKQCDVDMADAGNPREAVVCQHFSCSSCGHHFTMSHAWYAVDTTDWGADRREYRRDYYCVNCQKTMAKSVSTGWYLHGKNAVLTAPQADGGGGGGSAGVDQMDES